MFRRLGPLWVTLLLGCPQVLDDHFDVAGSVLDSGADAGVLGKLDATSPVIVSSVPADGTRGVLPDAALVLTFSTRMDRKSVEAGYSSTDLPASAVSFEWSPGDKVLRIRPKSPLRSASGSDPAAVTAVTYGFEIGAGARDAAGHALEPKRVSFSVARAITQPLHAVQNRDLTGNWRGDSIYGVGECDRPATGVCMGDSLASGEPAYKGFLTFDLRAVPPELIQISAAELKGNVSLVLGTPFTSLGTLQVEHIVFDTIGDAAFAAEPLPERQSWSSPVSAGDVLSFDLLAPLRSDWSVRNYSQFRLEFERATDLDGAVDVLTWDGPSAQLALTYWLP